MYEYVRVKIMHPPESDKMKVCRFDSWPGSNNVMLLKSVAQKYDRTLARSDFHEEALSYLYYPHMRCEAL